jgi:hypothetical protein
MPIAGSNNIPKSRKKTWIILGVIAVVLIAGMAAAVVIISNKNKDSDSSSSEAGASSNGTTPTGPTKFLQTGGDGSMVTMEDGTQFQYNNSFGGTWLFDAGNPFNGGQAQSWTPPINESWKWGQNRIYG